MLPLVAFNIFILGVNTLGLLSMWLTIYKNTIVALQPHFMCLVAYYLYYVFVSYLTNILEILVGLFNTTFITFFY